MAKRRSHSQKSTIIIISILVMLTINAAIQKVFNDHKNLKSTEELFNEYPDRVRSLIQALDLSSPSLNQVSRELQDGDTIAACEALIQHFKTVERDWVVSTLEDVSQDIINEHSRMLNSGIVSINDVKARVPLNAYGGWQWDFTGPNKDDEFGYSLNSHRYLSVLYLKYVIDNTSSYARTFDRIIKDWIIQHPLPEKGDSVYIVLDPTIYLDYRDIGEVEWRTLEAGRRLGAIWPQLYYGFQGADEFSNATRLLMLSSIVDQTSYLLHYHKKGHNWTTMEMNGLALAGLAFPEFKDSEKWANYALEVMSDEINRQVYPDGVQTEISTKTQWVALRRFESIADNFRKVGRQIDESYIKRLEEMYHYLAYSMRPDGHQPLNNDSDREDLTERVLVAADKYDRQDWRYIASNGKAGIKPKRSPSITFPWAGIQIMRSGWDKKDHWSFFDFGPYGTGHQHRDMLHLSISAYGEDMLVDGGRFTHQDYFSFDPTIWRGYFRSTHSHNTILIDGIGQKAGPLRAMNPLKEEIDYIHQPHFDYATGSFTAGYENTAGKLVHYRSVLYVKDQYWLVLDQVDTDKPRDLEVLWHFAPGFKIKMKNDIAESINNSVPNLKIVPLGNLQWETIIITGQEEPFKQGWYSETYGKKEPNPTLIYKTGIRESQSFAWLLVPSEGISPETDVNLQRDEESFTFNIKISPNTNTRIEIPLDRIARKVKVDRMNPE